MVVNDFLTAKGFAHAWLAIWACWGLCAAQSCLYIFTQFQAALFGLLQLWKVLCPRYFESLLTWHPDPA